MAETILNFFGSILLSCMYSSILFGTILISSKKLQTTIDPINNGATE